MLTMTISKYEVSYEIRHSDMDFKNGKISLELDEQLFAEFAEMTPEEQMKHVAKYGYVKMANIKFSDVEIIEDSIEIDEIIREEGSFVEYTEE